jgi:hypothetical protein
MVSVSKGEYRYGMNTQEKDNEIYGEGNSYSAEFWQYDARLGRRWNVDPRPNPSISTYATFANNPLFFSDPNGDTTWVFDDKGNSLDVINDDLPNQTHFIKSADGSKGYFGIMSDNIKEKEDGSFEIKDPNKFATDIRNNSTAFYTKKTEGAMRKAFKNSSPDKEFGFGLVFKPNSRELEFVLCKSCISSYNEKDNSYELENLDDITTDYPDKTFFATGHSHPKNAGYHAPKPTLPNSKSHVDYRPILNNNGHPAFILSERGITVYPANNKGFDANINNWIIIPFDKKVRVPNWVAVGTDSAFKNYLLKGNVYGH